MTLDFTVVSSKSGRTAKVTQNRNMALIVVKQRVLWIFKSEQTYIGRRNAKDYTFDWYLNGKLCIGNEWAELNCLLENRRFLNG